MSVDAYCNHLHLWKPAQSQGGLPQEDSAESDSLCHKNKTESVWLHNPTEIHDDYNKHRRSFMISLVPSPPDSTSDERHRLFLGDNNTYIERDLFAMYSENRYHFYNITGETPERLRCLLVELNLRPGTGFKLSPLNRVFLFLIWVRRFPTFAALATMFDISTVIVQVEIRKLIDIFYLFDMANRR